jgi:hypothetical protein
LVDAFKNINVPEHVDVTIRIRCLRCLGMILDLNNCSKSNSKHKYNDKEKNLIEIGHSENDSEFCFILKTMDGIPREIQTKIFDIFLNGKQ